MAVFLGKLIQFFCVLWLSSELVLATNQMYDGGANIGIRQTNGCDLFKGSWVKDKEHPLYNSSSCPFMGFDCLKNGRKDTSYLNFRWMPHGCDLPRFNGQDFLERNRGKKIMFVGDSLSNNMWQSLACMLHSAVPNSNYSISQSKLLSTLSFQEYGVSITFLKNGFLVDLVREEIGKVLKLDSISTGDQWKEVDMLIFNSFHWWVHKGSSKTWEYFQVGNRIVAEMDRMEAFKTALTTWANWININIDPAKTNVFYQGVSAVHLNGSEWNKPKARSCLRQTLPVMGSKYPSPTHRGEAIVRDVLRLVKEKVQLLDVTLLTQLRKDGHPSIYSGQGSKYVDCSHWCLPGVPDAWNELQYRSNKELLILSCDTQVLQIYVCFCILLSLIGSSTGFWASCG